MGSSDLTPAWLDRAQCVDSLRRATSRSRWMATPGSTVGVTGMERDVRSTGLPHQRGRSNLCLTSCSALRVTGGGCSMVISRLHDLCWQVHGCHIPSRCSVPTTSALPVHHPPVVSAVCRENSQCWYSPADTADGSARRRCRYSPRLVQT